MKFTDAELLMYVDGSLSEERASQLKEVVLHNKDLADSLKALDASQLPYRAAYAAKASQPIPEALRAQVSALAAVAVTTDSPPHRLQAASDIHIETGSGALRWVQGLSTAACVGLCVAFGYWLGAGSPLSFQSDSIGRASAGSAINIQTAWVQRVADYQSLYVANTVKDVVPNRARAAQFLDSIEQRTGLQTAIPDLSEAGYDFVRVQELGFNDEPLVQLVYSKPGSSLLALCFMPSGDISNSELVVADYHGLGTAGWIAHGQRFVLVGSEGEEDLRQLYTTVSEVFL